MNAIISMAEGRKGYTGIDASSQRDVFSNIEHAKMRINRKEPDSNANFFRESNNSKPTTYSQQQIPEGTYSGHPRKKRSSDTYSNTRKSRSRGSNHRDIAKAFFG